MKAYVMTLPLGILRAREQADIEGLREVFGSFGSIDFNLSRTSNSAYSVSIKRSRTREARGGVIEIEETVGGLGGDRLGLTHGEQVAFLGNDSS